MKARNTFLVLAVISIIIGFILFFVSQMEIITNDYYSWSRPYTDHETTVIFTRLIGIILLISGIVDAIICAVSYNYESKNIVNINQSTVSTKVCPICGLTVDIHTSVCPKCKNIIN